MTKYVCTHCGGTGQIQCVYPEGKVIDCFPNASASQIWEGAYFLLRQFIRCSDDGVFNPKADDEPETSCDGCDIERHEILSYLWHYGQAVRRETGTDSIDKLSTEQS